MRTAAFTLLLLLLTSGCILSPDNADVAVYMHDVQKEMNALSDNLNTYFLARARYNNGSIDAGEAYDNAVMASMKNDGIINTLNNMTPPKDFEAFHSLVLSSAHQIGSAYAYDMECIRSTENVSCEQAKQSVRQAQELSDNASEELGRLGVVVR